VLINCKKNCVALVSSASARRCDSYDRFNFLGNDAEESTFSVYVAREFLVARLRGRQAERDSGWSEVYDGISGMLATLMEYRTWPA